MHSWDKSNIGIEEDHLHTTHTPSETLFILLFALLYSVALWLNCM